MSKQIDDLVTHITAMSAPDFQELFSKLKELEPLKSVLDTASEPDRTNTLNKLKTFAERDTIPLSKSPLNHNLFSPSYSRFDFVNCYFTGVGFEWDAKHIALIWEVYPHLDSVMVIPTTSKTRPESKNVFSVGRIPGLRGGGTTLLISDMTRVSRKRIEPLDPYFHPKKGAKPVRLPVSWGERILYGIVSTYANESTFEETLKFKTQVAMVSDLRVLKTERFKAIRSTFDAKNSILEYRAWNNAENQQLQLIQPKVPLQKETKMKLIDDLFSEHELVRIQAEADYYNWYHYTKP